jgi:small subunit ribosomal protein S4
MGDPKKKHKLYTTPKRPYDIANLEEELRLVGTYGLRNKRELWRKRTELSAYRRRAREMLSLDPVERAEEQRVLLGKLNSLGLVSENATLEDVLTLNVQNFLDRRLQTMVHRKGMAKSLFQSRQLITHGHVVIDGKKVKAPGYNVSRADEASLDYSDSSPIHSKTHPLRQEMVADEVTGGEPVE